MDKQEKRKLLEKYIAKYNKDTDDSKAVIDFGKNLDLETKFIPTPIASLNKLLSRDGVSEGGFPSGKFTILSGQEKCGKTTLLLQTIGFHMSLNPDAIWAWVDSELTLDGNYVAQFGIDIDRFLIIKESTMEEVLQRLIDITKDKLVDGIVIDSVGALVPTAEIQNKDGKLHELSHTGMLDLQRKLGQFFRMSGNFVAKSKCPVIMIAHVYQDINTYGAPLVVKGGNALKHWSSVRLMLSRLQDKSTVIERVLPDGSVEKIAAGHDVKIKLDKTKVNDKEGQFVVIPFRYGIGFDCVESAVNVGIALGLITKSASIYSYADKKHKGKDSLIEYFKNTKADYDQLVIDIQKVSLSSIEVKTKDETNIEI